MDTLKTGPFGNLFRFPNVNIGKVGTAVVRCIFSVRVLKSAVGSFEKIGKTTRS
ncbi:hypothetical protein RSSM_04620 [Rhodopirellula sallentina SM41]|uniref:Uncharacterized protein n=1 Tax=Rhodopirellula sallentina SM41 TaxID=1263870 RepID=M5TY30_9BACT|nr:hypothetical protein RSSM_04620 [Rhodopirellula sallentina SM41]